MNIKRSIIILAGCLFMLTACTNKSMDSTLDSDKGQGPELTKLSADSPVDQNPANDVKQMLSKHETVKSVRAVNYDDQLIAGVQLKHHDRFNKDDIERDLQKEVEKNNPKMKVKLSTDEKIHLEVKKLEKALQNQKLSKKELKKKMKDIKSLSKEET